jgi:DNA-binding MurR/RpiR family transcriptional regulator
MATNAGKDSPVGSLDVRIRGLRPTLSTAEQRVADAVLADPARASASTITKLADRAGTSLTTVTRFCRALGLSGYSELRLVLAAEVGRGESGSWARAVSAKIGPRDPLDRVLASLVDLDTGALAETAAALDVATIKRVVALLAAARRIDIYAVSGSAVIGIDMQLRLHHIGRTAYIWQDVHDALASAALLGPRDVALAISHSGQSKETVEALGRARAAGARTVAITNYPRSALAAAAEITLTTAARETVLRGGAMSARHAQLLILDCLYIGVAQRTYSTTSAALAATADAVRDHR